MVGGTLWIKPQKNTATEEGHRETQTNTATKTQKNTATEKHKEHCHRKTQINTAKIC
jgi:hypothetical protein